MTTPGWRADERVIGDAYVFTDAGRTWNLTVLGCQPTGTGLNLLNGMVELKGGNIKVSR